jgi:hypothetical protein
LIWCTGAVRLNGTSERFPDRHVITLHALILQWFGFVVVDNRRYHSLTPHKHLNKCYRDVTPSDLLNSPIQL